MPVCFVLSEEGGKPSGGKMPEDAIVPTCLLLFNLSPRLCRAFAFWFEDVSRVRDPKVLEHSQASSVLNNNLVNQLPPPPSPTPGRLTPLFRASVSSHAGHERLPLGESTPRMGGFRASARSNAQWRMQRGEQGSGHEEEAENSPYQKAAEPH